MVPADVVLGVIDVSAVPPVATVYHCKVWPVAAVAVNALAVSPSQWLISVTVGEDGSAFTVTVISSLSLSKPLVSFWLT